MARLLVPLAALLVSLGCTEPVTREYRWPVFGEPLALTLHAAHPESAERIVEGMRLQTRRVEELLHPETGELAVLNRTAPEEPYPVEDRDLYVAIKGAIDYARASGGDYDPTGGSGFRGVSLFPEAHAVRLRPGGRLDLDGIRDGLALDSAARALTLVGSRGAVLRKGRGLRTWGSSPAGEPWRVVVADPRGSGGTLGTFDLDNRCAGIVAGDGTDVRVAVATAGAAVDATALAAALAAGGSLRVGRLLGKTHRVEAWLLVEGDGRPYVLASASLEGRVELSPEIAAEVGGRVRFLLPPETLDLPALGFGT